MAASSVDPNRLLDLSRSPQEYRLAALRHIEGVIRMLPSISASQWRLPTVLPFWRVGDVAAHLNVAAGFLLTSTRVMEHEVLWSSRAWTISRRLNLITPVAFPALHYSNIVMPRLATSALSQRTIAGSTESASRRLSAIVARLPEARLTKCIPYFRWSVPMHLYLAVMAREFGLHRWEIENAISPTPLDPEIGSVALELLWAAAAVYGRIPRRYLGVVEVEAAGRAYTWNIGGGKVRPVPPAAPGMVDVRIAGAVDRLALALMGRAPPDPLAISGNGDLANAFLAAFSYRAGPAPFFNP